MTHHLLSTGWQWAPLFYHSIANRNCIVWDWDIPEPCCQRQLKFPGGKWKCISLRYHCSKRPSYELEVGKGIWVSAGQSAAGPQVFRGSRKLGRTQGFYKAWEQAKKQVVSSLVDLLTPLLGFFAVTDPRISDSLLSGRHRHFQTHLLTVSFINDREHQDSKRQSSWLQQVLGLKNGKIKNSERTTVKKIRSYSSYAVSSSAFWFTHRSGYPRNSSMFLKKIIAFFSKCIKCQKTEKGTLHSCFACTVQVGGPFAQALMGP